MPKRAKPRVTWDDVATCARILIEARGTVVEEFTIARHMRRDGRRGPAKYDARVTAPDGSCFVGLFETPHSAAEFIRDGFVPEFVGWIEGKTRD
jgi:hypothetical protein